MKREESVEKHDLRHIDTYTHGHKYTHAHTYKHTKTKYESHTNSRIHFLLNIKITKMRI